MKTSRIALIAALGTVALALPAAAAPSLSGGADARAAKPAAMQVAQQNATRAINEARGGNYKSTKAKKKKTHM
jgi:hypothetical protein